VGVRLLRPDRGRAILRTALPFVEKQCAAPEGGERDYLIEVPDVSEVPLPDELPLTHDVVLPASLPIRQSPQGLLLLPPMR
jgi:hypothetical protein